MNNFTAYRRRFGICPKTIRQMVGNPPILMRNKMRGCPADSSKIINGISNIQPYSLVGGEVNNVDDIGDVGLAAAQNYCYPVAMMCANIAASRLKPASTWQH